MHSARAYICIHGPGTDRRHGQNGTRRVIFLGPWQIILDSVELAGPPQSPHATHLLPFAPIAPVTVYKTFTLM
jgi:hypothetical protein